MKGKKVSLSAKPQRTNKPSADAWVKSKSDEAVKRLTLDIPASLHARVKSECARMGANMTEVVRDLLEKEFPA